MRAQRYPSLTAGARWYAMFSMSHNMAGITNNVTYPSPAPWLGGLLTSGYSDVRAPGWLSRGSAGAGVGAGTEAGAGELDIRASGREDQNSGKS